MMSSTPSAPCFNSSVEGVSSHVSKSEASKTVQTEPSKILLSGRFNPNDASVNPIVFQTGKEAQQARLDQLKNRWVAIITSGFELTKCQQYEQMASFGLKIFLVEDVTNPVAIELARRGVVTHVPVDLTPSSDLVERVVDGLQRACNAAWDLGERPNMDGMEDQGMLSACWTIWDDGVCLASRIQQALGLRGDVPDIIDTCHDKYLARKRLETNGVIGPKSFLLRDMEDAKVYGAELRYPIVLKPINGAASIGIHFFKSHEELLEKLPNCQQELRDIYSDSELMGLVFEDSNGVTSSDALLYFCAEEYIGGQEFDIDILFTDGEPVYANVGQDWKYKDGWMCERGMHHPAGLPSTDYQRIVDAAISNAKSLGCTTGVYHVEMKDDPDLGPQMIECNPRMGGGPVWDFHRLAWGVDLILEAAFAFLGLPNRPEKLDEPLGVAISLLLFSDKSGILREDIQSVNSEIIQHPLTTFFVCPGKKGEEIRGWYGNRYPSHIGRVDFFVDKNDPQYPTAIEWGLNQRSRVIVPFEDGDHQDPNDDSL